MITGNSNGNKIYYNQDEQKWFYIGTDKIMNDNDTCKKCGKSRTKEGYDACIGYLEGAIHACCGHGINKSYCILKNNEYIEFDFIIDMKKYFNLKEVI